MRSDQIDPREFVCRLQGACERVSSMWIDRHSVRDSDASRKTRLKVAAVSQLSSVAQEAPGDYVQFVCQSGFSAKFQALMSFGRISADVVAWRLSWGSDHFLRNCINFRPQAAEIQVIRLVVRCRRNAADSSIQLATTGMLQASTNVPGLGPGTYTLLARMD